jgi:hypothetical protein
VGRGLGGLGHGRGLADSGGWRKGERGLSLLDLDGRDVERLVDGWK